MTQKRHGNVLLISDLHAPYHNPDALDFLCSLKKAYKPSRVIFMGDVFDNFTSSRYGSHSGADGANREWETACEFALELAAEFPVADVLFGNHEERPLKKASENGIPTELIRPISEVPRLAKAVRNWKWASEIHINPETVAVHGDGFGGANPGETAVLKHRKNVAFAHLHTRLGVCYYARGEWQNWALNTGCLIDPNSVANEYAKHHTKRPILGAAVLLDGRTPLPIPMN